MKIFLKNKENRRNKEIMRKNIIVELCWKLWIYLKCLKKMVAQKWVYLKEVVF